MPEEITIRKASADQWQLYKQIRLAALQDSPDAFGSSFEHESKLSSTKDQIFSWRSTKINLSE